MPEFRGRQLSPEERRRALAARNSEGSVPPPPGTSRGSSGSSTGRRGGGSRSRRRGASPSLRIATVAAPRRTDRALRRPGRSGGRVEKPRCGGQFSANCRVARPRNAPLSDRYQKAERSAAAALADRYLEQARYDERRGHFAEAAKAYERVLRGKPTALAYERSAFCLLESRADMKRAGEYARKAVELAPTETAYRITLARVFARAGMEQSAIGRTRTSTDAGPKAMIRLRTGSSA